MDLILEVPVALPMQYLQLAVQMDYTVLILQQALQQNWWTFQLRWMALPLVWDFNIWKDAGGGFCFAAGYFSSEIGEKGIEW